MNVRSYLNVGLFSFLAIAKTICFPECVCAQGETNSTFNFQIHLLTNQDKYANGETVFLKAYFLNRNGKGVEGKQLITVFLVDYRGISHQTIRFNALGGIGVNQLTLPDRLEPGNYRLVAYVSPVEERSYGYITSRTITVLKENSIVVQDPLAVRGVDSVASPSGPITLTVAKSSFQRKEKITVTVAVHDSLHNPVRAEFSVAVLNKKLNVEQPLGLMMDGLYVGEDNRYFRLQSNSESAVDLANTEALSRISAFQKNGRVINLETGEAVPDRTQVLFYLQRTGWYHQTFTLGNGSVRLNLPQFTGSDNLFYLGETERGKIIPIKIDWDKSETPQFAMFSQASDEGSKDAYATFANNQRVIQQSYEAFAGDGNDGEEGDEDDEFDLVDPDNVYRPDKFITFNTMAEMILEVIPGMFHRKTGKTEIVRLTLPDPMTATADPVYFIDGWATTRTEFFLSLKPSDLEYIAIVKEPKKLQPLKLLGKNGIVIVKSKPGKTNRPPVSNDEKLEGLNPAKQFRNAISPTLPEFRSTLYWNPSLSTDRDGRASFEFDATDDVGEMVIRVEGVTAEGIPFQYRMPIQIN